VILLPLLLPALVLPYLVLFVFVRRLERERFWRSFLLYFVAATVCGIAVITVGALLISYAPFRPVLESYIGMLAQWLSRLGGPGLARIVPRLCILGSWLMIWYAGLAIGAWVVWHEHTKRRRNVISSGTQSQEH